MAIKLEAVRYAEDLSQFYLNELVPLSDQVYRFSYALTLSAAGAMKIMEWAYIEVTSDLDRVRKEKKELLALFRHCWQRFSQLKGKTWSQDSDNRIAQHFASMPTKARAIFTAVDIMGLPLDEFKGYFAWDDQCLKDLALARKTVVQLDLD